MKLFLILLIFGLITAIPCQATVESLPTSTLRLASSGVFASPADWIFSSYANGPKQENIVVLSAGIQAGNLLQNQQLVAQYQVKSVDLGIGFQRLGLDGNEALIFQEYRTILGVSTSLYNDLSTSANLAFMLETFNLSFDESAKNKISWTYSLGFHLSMFDRVSLNAGCWGIKPLEFGSGENATIPSILRYNLQYSPVDILSVGIANELSEDFNRWSGAVKYKLSQDFDIYLGIKSAPAAYSTGFSYRIKSIIVEYGISYLPGLTENRVGLVWFWNE